MRSLVRHGSNIGVTGWQQLALQDTENKIAVVKAQKCKDCGQPLGEHVIEGSTVTCPPIFTIDDDSLGDGSPLIVNLRPDQLVD